MNTSGSHAVRPATTVRLRLLCFVKSATRVVSTTFCCIQSAMRWRLEVDLKFSVSACLTCAFGVHAANSFHMQPLPGEEIGIFRGCRQ